MCCLSPAPSGGPGPRPRHVPGLDIEPRLFGSQAAAQSTEPRQPAWRNFEVNFVLSGDWGWWSGLKPSRLPLRVTDASPQDRREARRSLRYLELYIVADHTLVRGGSRGLSGLRGASSACHTTILLPFQFLTQHRDLNHTKQRLLEIANYVDQVGGRRVWADRLNGSDSYGLGKF